MDTTSKESLQDWAIVGFDERWHSVAADHRQPGGSCWWCGTAIAYCVIIENRGDHRREIIGTTCAERVGMDTEEVRRHSDAYYRGLGERARAEREVVLAAQFGEHGSVARFESGCPCERCVAVAPHGTWIRWREGCRCIECVDGLVADNPRDYRIEQEYPVIVELATGCVVAAEVVQGKFGSQWLVRSRSGERVYLRRFAAQRATLAKKGFVEAVAPALVDGSGRDHRLLLALGEPLVDIWGTPIPRPAGRV